MLLNIILLLLLYLIYLFLYIFLYQSNFELCDPSSWKIGGELGLVAKYELISE